MTPGRILVLKPGSLGDIVHTLPAVAALKTRFPQSAITWLVNPEWEPLLEGNPHLASTLIFPRGDFRGPSGLLRFLAWRRTLPSLVQPDLILDFQGLLRTAVIGRAFGGVPAWGLADAREGSRWLHTRSIPVEANAHAVERYLTLAAALGATPPGPPEFFLPPGRRPEAALPDRPWILLHPFSRGEGKSLSAEAIRAFCRAAGHPVVLAGRSQVAIPAEENVTDLVNRTTLAELLWLIRHAAFTVSVDSGPSHMAAAVTDHLLAIHTRTDPCRVGPYRPGATVWKGGTFHPALDPSSSREPTVVPGAGDATAMAGHVRERMAAA
jgi:ADP-heptose:LPS heptosyltransferase